MPEKRHSKRPDGTEYPRSPVDCLFSGGHIYEPGVDVCPRCGRPAGKNTNRVYKSDDGGEGDHAE